MEQWHECKNHGLIEGEAKCLKCMPVQVCGVCGEIMTEDDESAVCEICDNLFHWLDCGAADWVMSGGGAVCDNCRKHD